MSDNWEEEVKRKSEEEARGTSSPLSGAHRPSSTSSMPSFLGSAFTQRTPPSQQGQFSATVSSPHMTSGLPPTPQQIRFTGPYSSREPFSSPSLLGSDLSQSFTHTYGSRQPFSSPNPPFDPLSQSTQGRGPMSRTHRTDESALRPTDLSNRFSSAATSDSSNFLAAFSQPPLIAQTEPGQWPRVNTQSGADPWSSRPSMNPPLSFDTYGSFANYDPFLSYRSEQRPVPSTLGRSYSTGDLPDNLSYTGEHQDDLSSMGDVQDDLAQRLRDFSFGESDFQYTLRRPPPQISRQSSASTFPEQTEPSVRPKVRTPLQPTGSPPRPIANEIPEPPIVQRYMDPTTGEPNLQLLRNTNRLPESPSNTETDLINRAIELANLSRQNIKEVINAASKSGRKEKYLKDRGFQGVEYNIPGRKKPLIRYASMVPFKKRSPSAKPHLSPQNESGKYEMFDPKFNKPLNQMDRKNRPDSLGPVGRQGYGPLSRRAMSLPNLNAPDLGADLPQSNLQQFRDRYGQLEDEHKNTYLDYRKSIDWRQNVFARNRMIKVPNLMNIADENKFRLDEIRDTRVSRLTPIRDSSDAAEQRRARRLKVGQDAVLPSAFGGPTDKDYRSDWLFQQYVRTIPEEDEEEEEEEVEGEEEGEGEKKKKKKKKKKR